MPNSHVLSALAHALSSSATSAGQGIQDAGNAALSGVKSLVTDPPNTETGDLGDLGSKGGYGATELPDPQSFMQLLASKAQDAGGWAQKNAVPLAGGALAAGIPLGLLALLHRNKANAQGKKHQYPELANMSE